MTDTACRFSTREVRARIWQTLKQHFLPMMLALALAGLPQITAAVLDGIQAEYLLQARSVRTEALAFYESGSELTAAQQDLFFRQFAEHAVLQRAASRFDLAASLLNLLGLLLSPALLFGVNLVLISILRGGEFSWRDAWLSFAEFKRGFKLQCYILVLLLILEIPAALLKGFSSMLGAEGSTPGLILQLLALLLTFTFTFIARLRFQLAPRLLADGAEDTAGELIDKSLEILDWRALRPMLSLLFPGLLMLLAGWLLHTFCLQLIMPRAIAGLLRELLFLPAWGYLITGSAAIYATFRCP